MIAPLVALVVAYLVGSISFAWIAGRLKGVDLRQHGSGNLGATNAGRTLGSRWFAFVFLGDMSKGLVMVLAARVLPDLVALEITAVEAQYLLLAAAVGAVLGHVFTCYHRFRGGKAVATSLGVLLGVAPLVAALAGAVWLLAWLIGIGICRVGKSGAVAPASLLGAITTPGIHLLVADKPFGRATIAITVFLFLLAVLVVVRHRSNIAKMLRYGVDRDDDEAPSAATGTPESSAADAR